MDGTFSSLTDYQLNAYPQLLAWCVYASANGCPQEDNRSPMLVRRLLESPWWQGRPPSTQCPERFRGCLPCRSVVHQAADGGPPPGRIQAKPAPWGLYFQNHTGLLCTVPLPLHVPPWGTCALFYTRICSHLS